MKHELFINGYKIDLSEDIPFPISFSVSDIKNPESRKRSVSKTITIQGTKNNKNIFASAYELSISDEGLGLGFTIDTTKRVTARYVKNSREIFNGLCQLLEVNIDNGNYTFEIVLYSDFVNLFQQWGDIKVSELGWNEYDHTLNETNLSNSWDTSVIQNGVATSNFTSGNPDGFGYIYPVIDFGYNSSLYTFNINDFVPYVYCKEVIEKAFDYVGKSISSDFLTSDMFKSLVFGFGGGKKNMLPPADVSDRRVNYSFDGSYTGNASILQTFYNPSTLIYGHIAFLSEYINLSNFTETQINDGYAQYDSGTGTINIQRSGNYKLNLDFTVLLNYTLSTGSLSNNTSARFVIRKNGNIIHQTNAVRLPNSPTSYNVDVDKELNLLAGDFLTIEFFVFSSSNISSSSVPSLSYTVDFNNDFSFDLTSIEGVYNEGDIITLSRFIPDMKVSDFIKGMITMFNLYIDETDVTETIKIEPLSDFYLDISDVDNWTKKLDHSRNIKVKPASSINGKTYHFKFLEDNDTYNKIYFDEFGEYYGNYTYDVENGYQKGGRNFTVPFAQTVPVEVSGGYVMPRIVNIDLTTNLVEPYKGKPRIFFYNGLQTGNFNITDSSGNNSYTTYPQVHHSYGDITQNTFDLNFGIPRKVFYTFTKYGQNNLFNDYHRQFIREISNRDSKLLIAYFKLDDLDIYDGMFRKLVNINGVLFRKNVIHDYNATGYQTTKVELLKVLETNDPYTTPPILAPDLGYADQRSVTITAGADIVGQGADIINGGIDSGLETQEIFTVYGNII